MKWNNRSMMKTLFGLLLTMMLVFTAACGANTNTENKPGNTAANTEQSATNEPAPTEEAAAYPLTIKDDTGTEVTFEQAPTKVVTLVPSETEAIYAIGSGEQVVGVDEYSNYPEEAASKPKVGDMTTNIEAVTALNPDLVLASSSMNTEAITKLRELNITVFASDPLTYDAVIAKIETLGKIMNKLTEAAAVADNMRTAKQQVTDAVKNAEKKKVYLEFSPGWSVGTGTFLDELLTLAGGQNIASAKQGWFEISAEEVITQNPQLIIYPALKEDPNPIVVGIESRPGWDVIDAVKNKQMHAVTEDPLVRVGPRLADGLLELVKVIHPDLVK
ncbi:ABC transporter substrate-binding protein [Paenibacillus prosopidis]|uniref:Iron complex transport system substrate-binding protein n=1 Tax=Paenibacillus prosopidis TaxID=630520 RepID=A0A368W5D3_9BACL|nr:ABC transporter substrate-binding protein [Paenibacillus prosopidis]RCW50304.1 iron complex transport system substrate-binding protein [Paenibacillus prosopidis]